jgi:heat shock protein HslJ
MVGSDWHSDHGVRIRERAQSDMDAERYTITFRDNGDFNAQADCNRLLGSWSIEDTSVSLTPGPTTLAACPADSRSDDFITWLTASHVGATRQRWRADAHLGGRG